MNLLILDLDYSFKYTYMNTLSQYITFLKEYKKLLERGVKDILNSTIAENFIWINDIQEFIDSGICSSILPDIFSSDFNQQPILFLLEKVVQPAIEISSELASKIKFDEVKNDFISVNGKEEELILFLNSDEGTNLKAQLKEFVKNKEVYSKLYRASNDLKNDSNLEIVLSVGLIQYSQTNNRGDLSKTNQHLFHFPLSLDIDKKSNVTISFSEIENPYADFFFLNNTGIEKTILSEIIERFEKDINKFGYNYIFEDSFKDLVADNLQKISSNSYFENSIVKPISDHSKQDFFKISFSPAINIKPRKPRFFDKLTDSIIEYSNNNNVEAKLFNLLVRNPEAVSYNPYENGNYFKDDLFEKHKSKIKHLNGEEDFSVFFPLPFNKEQKEIYENYLKNRLTVVTGPPGTGKSHTIVNILCSLLAQGKRVLVTAQTDKALESLLDKIPDTFDDLIFTKIKLETNPNRFSLEKSINNISKILQSELFSNIDSKVEELDNLKADYLVLKSQIIQALEKEYQQISINDSFTDLRPYQIVEKFEKKDSIEWSWIQDVVSNEDLKNFEAFRDKILQFRNSHGLIIKYDSVQQNDLITILTLVSNFDFKSYLDLKGSYEKQLQFLNLSNERKEQLLKINLESIVEITKDYSNSDIILKSRQDLNELQSKINLKFRDDNLNANRLFTDLTENADKYLLDIETYLSFIEQEKAGFLTRFKTGFKNVAYLENFTINGKKSETREIILSLKILITNYKIISKNLTLLRQSGFSVEVDESSNLTEKANQLKVFLQKVEKNRAIFDKIQSNLDFMRFSEYCQTDLFDIDTLARKAVLCRDDFKSLKNLEFQFNDQLGILHKLDYLIENSSIKDAFQEFLPINKITEQIKFDELKNRVLNIKNQINIQQTYLQIKNQLIEKLPNTFETLATIPQEYISKENFEFASANAALKKDSSTDLQKSKEELTHINNKIYKVKCDILFHLAKSNFKNLFNSNEVDLFINLLGSYKYNLSQSVRKVSNQTQFQILTRQNSIDISKKLSCWVMKFTDVLNSVGDKPEVFDCIIVDEASQLDFNSLILGYYAKNMIIVGDDKQTSPSSLTSANGDDFEAIKNDCLTFLGTNKIHIKSDNSLFSLAKMTAGRSNLTLIEHFRCVPEIIEFSKKHFYDNSLRPLKQINSNRLSPKESFFVEDSYKENGVVYKEIDAIKTFLKQILTKKEYSNKTIGVVSLGLSKHTEKLKNIKEYLANEFGKEKIDRHKLIIEDSPKFQGDERDVMLISLGVALDSQKLNDNQNATPRAIIRDNNQIKDEEKKINVALSRAKEQMILFHSIKSEGLRENDFRNEILRFFNEEIKPLAPFQLPDYDLERNRHNVPAPFDSWFEFDITRDLLKEGYSYIHPQYKVKENETFYNHKLGKDVYVNFKLDLVVYNNGKMIAVECDGDPFHSIPEDVAYDNERQEFLERVGWKVVRVLYSAYKRDKSKEIKKMVDFIERNTKKDDYVSQNEAVLTFSEDKHNNSLDIIDYSETEELIIDNYEEEIVIPSINGIIENKDCFQSIQLESISDKVEGKILRYFNLFEDNTYKLQEYSVANCLYSVPIYEKHENGFLLQCYDNGHINKVHVKSILAKRLDYHYSTGKNPSAKLLYLKFIEEDAIIGIKIKKGRDKVFKAHKTENISSRDLLQLQGYKVLYQDFDSIEYKILPKNILNDIKRLVFESFTASGKLTNNHYYESEWNIIKFFMPNLE
jgi:hypothetical protein